MPDRLDYRCPNCGARIKTALTEKAPFVCDVCETRYEVLMDDATGRAAFLEHAARKSPEPLYLPTGSVRALTALAVAVSCWTLMFMGRDAPNSLLVLMITIVGYYFGFRARVKGMRSRILDPLHKSEEPLFLPEGSVRMLLIFGFVASAVMVHFHEKLVNWRDAQSLRYLEFFAVLFGLVLGFFWARLTGSTRQRALYVLINHLKGALALAAAAFLAYLFISGDHKDAPRLRLDLLCSVISFYYGSRT